MDDSKNLLALRPTYGNKFFTQKVIAQTYGISLGTVSRIVTGADSQRCRKQPTNED